MTNDEILQAAKEAGCHFPLRSGFGDCRVPQFFGIDGLERFATIIEKIIEKRTIERCASVCEMLRDLQIYADKQEAQNDCAAAIRKLGEQE